MSNTLIERFWDKVDRRGHDECWPWRASLAGKGYGHLGVGAHGEGFIYAHRLSWELANGPIPEGMFICHHCDNPRCVNPGHLFLATPKDNIRDMVEKGRGLRGVKNGQAKLSSDQVRQIRKLYATGKYLQRELGKMFGVSSETISSIIHRKLWGWLD